MANPTWFDESAYIANKLAQLKSTEPNTAWNESTLKAVLAQNNMSAYDHFVNYGAKENVSPNADFVVSEYLAAKAALMNAKAEGGLTNWTEASVAKAITDAGMTVWDHYLQWGTKEGVNPSNAFDAAAYCAAKAAVMNANGELNNGVDWTADSIKDAINNAGMSVLTHYEMYKGADKNEVPAAAVYHVAADAKVTPSITFDPYQPQNSGSAFTLKADGNNIAGTANSDTITGDLANLQSGDSIVDTNANDQDLMVLNAGTATTVTANGATIKGIENVTVKSDAVRALTVTASDFTGLQTLRVETTADTFNDLTVNGLSTATVYAAKAGNVTLTGTAKADNVTLVTNNAAVAVSNNNANAIETLTLSSDINSAITLTDASTAAHTIKTAGDGNITLKMTADNFGTASADTVTKGNTGTLTVELADSATTINTTTIGADSITLAAGTQSITAANGQSFNTATGTSGLTFSMATGNTGKADNVNVKLADSTTATLTLGANLESLTVATGKSDAITLSGSAGTAYTQAVTLTGSEAVTLSAVTDIDTLNAAAYTGDITLSTGATIHNATVLAGSGTNTIALSADSGETTVYTGGTGKDLITLSAGTATAAADAANVVVKTGAGDDTVTFGNTGDLSVVSVDLGDGKNTVNAAAAVSLNGDVTVKGGAGVDTVTFASAVSALGNLTIDTAAGDDVITFSALNISSGSVTIKAGEGNDKVTFTAVTGADSDHLTVDLGAGDDTITFGNGTGFSAASAFGIKLDGGAGTDTISFVDVATSVAYDFSDSSITGIDVVDLTALGGQQVTVGNNFAGSAYAVNMAKATAAANVDKFTVDLTNNFAAVAKTSVADVKAAGDWYVNEAKTQVVYADDDADVITVTLTGVDTATVTSDNLVLAGATV